MSATRCRSSASVWLTQRGSPQGDVAFDAVEAGLSAFAFAEVGKLVVDRARPEAGLGPASFGVQKHRTGSSFPSVQSALAWAVLPPYAEHYRHPWLYGAAALTGAARVMGRHHWVSDTVGGALLGYWIGDYLYQHGRTASDRPQPRVAITPQSLVLSLPFD